MARAGARRWVSVAVLVGVIMTVAGVQHALATLPPPLFGPGPAYPTVLHVPMSWCVVNGSPAQTAPNITSEGTNVTDNNTDAVIWRRHERPTDNVFLPQA